MIRKYRLESSRSLSIFLISLFCLSTGCTQKDERYYDTCEGVGPAPEVQYTILDYSVRFEHLTDGQIEGELNPTEFVVKIDSEISEAWVKSDSKRYFPRFSIFPLAYACTLVPNYISLQELTTFEIYSTGSFGGSYPPGKNLLELFRIYPSYSDIDPFLFEVPRSLDLSLLSYPEESEHIFTIKIVLDESIVYELKSEVIRFNLVSDSAF